MRPRARALLPLVACLALARPALAAREWYDYYLQARDRDVPSKKWDDCVRNLREALRLRPTPANNLQTYGLQFVQYVPHYWMGVCLQGQGDHAAAIEAFDRSEQLGAIRKTGLQADLARRRSDSQAAEQARVTRRARGEVTRLLQRAQELGRRAAYEEALARLAEAEVLARSLDTDTLRSVTREQQRLRAAKQEAQDAADRARRLDERLADGERLLGEGRATEAMVAFEDALALDPKNERALAGRRAADEGIQASTTRAARERSLAEGRALLEAGRYEDALEPLTDAASDPTLEAEARALLGRARQVLEGLRRQRQLRADIERLMGEGERLMREGRFPEAQVALDSVLRLDPDHARARERHAEAERRTGEALFARWLPNREPRVALFQPEGEVVEAPSILLRGVASDDRGVERVEFRVAGRLVAEEVPETTPAEPARLHRFVRQLPLEPGSNLIEVRAVDTGGLVHSVAFSVGRRLRFHETRWFLPAAAGGALSLLGLAAGTQLLRRRRARRRRFNPYIAGAPVLDDDMFFGRKKLTARMLSTLHRNSLMITGERRIGKTTFLHHLKRVLAEDTAGDWRFFPVFVDLQGVPEQSFFHALMAEVADALELSPATRRGLRHTPDPAGYEARDFAHDLQLVLAELKGRTDKRVRLALLIDEVDVLNEYSESVNQRLRGIFMKSFSENLVAVMSGVGIKRRWKSEVSPWYNFFDEIELTPFSREEAEALVREPVAGVFRWQPEAVELVLELSRLKPYLIQKLCAHAVNRMLEDDRTRVRVADVEAARELAMTRDEEPVPTGSVAD